MLSETTRELLSAAVDGELSPSEKKAVRVLLRQSVEARAYYSQLKTDSGEVAALVPLKSPFDFSKAILGTIVDTGLRPTPPPPVRMRPLRSSVNTPAFWAGLAGIAAVLMVVVSTSYFFFVVERSGVPQSQVVENKKPTPPVYKQPVVPKTNVGAVEPEISDPPQIVVRETAEAVELLPTPREVDRNTGVLATPLLPTPELLDPARIRLSLVLSLRELDQPWPQKRLKEELTRGEVVRVDLFCRDLYKANEAVQSALRAKSHQLHVESTVADRLAKKTGELVIYTESMNPDEIFALLDGLGSEERKLTSGKADPLFDNFVLAPSVPGDLTRLSVALGMPVSAFKGNRVKAAPDLRKPLSDSTGPQLAGSLGKGSPASPAKAVDKIGVVAPWSPPMANPAQSKEIRAFFEKRGERKGGNVPLILVLRPIA